MAMTPIQKNIVEEFQLLAVNLLQLKPRLATAASLYVTEALGALTDADYLAEPEFQNLTVSEMANALVAINAVIATIGEYAAGTNAIKLAKILNRVP